MINLIKEAFLWLVVPLVALSLLHGVEGFSDYLIDLRNVTSIMLFFRTIREGISKRTSTVEDAICVCCKRSNVDVVVCSETKGRKRPRVVVELHDSNGDTCIVISE